MVVDGHVGEPEVKPAGFFLHSLFKCTEKGIFLLKITEKRGGNRTTPAPQAVPHATEDEIVSQQWGKGGSEITAIAHLERRKLARRRATMRMNDRRIGAFALPRLGEDEVKMR